MTVYSLYDFEASDVPILEWARPIERPQNAKLRALLALWHDRPSDGFESGRDVPSRRFAPLLSHILLWEPIDGGADYVLRLCGEGLRLRFGDGAVGKRFQDVIGPEVVPAFLDIGRKMLAKDSVACFDMNLMRKEPVDGRSELHFELVIFPIWSHNRTDRWILNGAYYFL